MILKLMVSFLALILSYRNLILYRNYIAARRIGLPIIVTPLSWQDPVWMLVAPKFAWLERLPFGLGSWYRYSYLGWNLYDRYDTHKRLGGAFTIVSPQQNEVILCHTSNLRQIMHKYHKWQRPRVLYSIFAGLGENAVSVNEDEWQKHRKVINTAFTENHLAQAWEAARKQTGQWLGNTNEKTLTLKELAADCDNLSGNVLMYAVFGRDYTFGKGRSEPPKGHNMSLYDAMHFMIQNVILLWLIGKLGLPEWIEPKKLKEFKEVKKELLLYFDETLETQDSDFVRSLVAANESENISGRGILTQTELHGNLFLTQLAGQDTTSYTINFTLAWLAIHPEIQEWARTETSTYEESFEKAVRIRALMYETLRMDAVVALLFRQSTSPEQMHINGKDVVIPPFTFMGSNLAGQSHDPDLWGDNAAEWQPKRWVEMIDGIEVIRKDLPEMLAWNTGPRNCPGKKFSQVEFTAAMSKILTEYRVAGSPGLQSVLEDYEFKVTPKVRKPENGSITFLRR